MASTVYKRSDRPRRKRIEVSLTPDEWEEIAERAKKSGRSLSAYLREVGLNHRIRSVCDLEAVIKIGKVNGDLGRVAGLLKLWLKERPGVGIPKKEVEQMMIDFRRLQLQMSDLMRQVLKCRP